MSRFNGSVIFPSCEIASSSASFHGLRLTLDFPCKVFKLNAKE